MNLHNPTSGIVPGLPVNTKSLCDAEDILCDAIDFANLISMTHRRSSRREDPDGASVSASALHVCDLIQKAVDLMQVFRAGFSMSDDFESVKNLMDEDSAIAEEIDRMTDSTNRHRSPPSRILELFREHCKIRDAAKLHVPSARGKAEDEEMEELFWKRSDVLVDRINAEPCTSAADFAAKMIIETSHGEMIPDWDKHPIWQEARRLVGMRDLTP